jgi:hypothetical protein
MTIPFVLGTSPFKTSTKFEDALFNIASSHVAVLIDVTQPDCASLTVDEMAERALKSRKEGRTRQFPM